MQTQLERIKSNTAKLQQFQAQAEQRLQKLAFTLDRDPSSKSPARLYQLVYKARCYSDAAGVLYAQSMKIESSAKDLLFLVEHKREAKLRKIFAEHNQDVSKFRSTAEKERYYISLLPEDVEQAWVAVQIYNKKTYAVKQLIRHYYDHAKDIRADLLNQSGIVRTMIQLGELASVNIQNSTEENITQAQALNHMSDTFSPQQPIIESPEYSNNSINNGLSEYDKQQLKKEGRHTF